MNIQRRKIVAASLLAPAFCKSAFSAERIRVSGWYWLNAAPRSEWARDFQKMSELGFTDVLLCWGLDLTAWTVRPEDTRFALDAAQKAKLGAYIIVWHPTHNTLSRSPEFMQVTATGKPTFAFNAFNAKWRSTQYKEYLQKVARLVSPHPAFAGYVFDDSFMIGNLEEIEGPVPRGEDRYISYSSDDVKRYGKQPPKLPSEPGWAEWTNARSEWWAEWARDTMRFIREVDRNPKHEVYLEDSTRVLAPGASDSVGLDFSKVAQPFDAVGIYTMGSWNADPASAKKTAALATSVIEKTRAAAGTGKKLIYTFWVANPAELRKPGPATYPTFEQITEICEAGLRAGVRHLDMYGYRIGDFVVNGKTWPLKRPPAKGPYPLTDPYPGKHLYDRTELHQELGKYLRSLAQR